LGSVKGELSSSAACMFLLDGIGLVLIARPLVNALNVTVS
jgi:hypothetical protein